jgi:hypothetical protein
MVFRGKVACEDCTFQKGADGVFLFPNASHFSVTRCKFLDLDSTSCSSSLCFHLFGFLFLFVVFLICFTAVDRASPLSRSRRYSEQRSGGLQLQLEHSAQPDSP